MKKHAHNLSLYEISVLEISIMFTIIFLIYTMPISVYKFSTSFFGKVLILGSIIFASYKNITYGVILAVLFMLISEIGRLERFTNMQDSTTSFENINNFEGMVVREKTIPVKEAFIKEHCSAKKTKFNLETIEKDFRGLEFTDGVCDPCDATCRYNISNTADNLYQFDKLVKPVDATYVANTTTK